MFRSLPGIAMLALLLAGSESVAVTDTTSPSNCAAITEWKFSSQKQPELRDIFVGLSLTDPAQNISATNGTYTARLSSEAIHQFKEPVIYFPAIGGLEAIQLGGDNVTFASANFSGVGPIVEIKDLRDAKSLDVHVKVQGDSSSFSGMWKAPPLLCERNTAEFRRAVDRIWQEVVPNALSLLCLIFSTLFWFIFKLTKNKVTKYRQFSIALILWSLY